MYRYLKSTPFSASGTEQEHQKFRRYHLAHVTIYSQTVYSQNVPFIFADSEKPLIWWLYVASFFFMVATLITVVLFKQFLIRTAV